VTWRFWWWSRAGGSQKLVEQVILRQLLLLKEMMVEMLLTNREVLEVVVLELWYLLMLDRFPGIQVRILMARGDGGVDKSSNKWFICWKSWWRWRRIKKFSNRRNW
jgi:hypothetical protein